MYMGSNYEGNNFAPFVILVAISYYSKVNSFDVAMYGFNRI